MTVDSDGSGVADSTRNTQHATLILKEGAWLIADAHYAHYNTSLYDFLSKLEPEDLPPQMIFMGDIFDLLFGHAPNSIESNRKMVDLLERISMQTEVVYLEGNHDFGLKEIFGNTIKIVERSQQPLIAIFADRRIALHHGDILQGIGYEIYTAWIRNRWVDRILNRIDTICNGAIIRWLENYNRKKRPCYRIEGFEERMRERMKIMKEKYSFDIWIDGHYHQNVMFRFTDVEYVNLPAFACSGSYTIMKNSGNGIEFKESKDRNGV